MDSKDKRVDGCPNDIFDTFRGHVRSQASRQRGMPTQPEERKHSKQVMSFVDLKAEAAKKNATCKTVNGMVLELEELVGVRSRWSGWQRERDLRAVQTLIFS
jgi:hypothetical protein